MSSVARKDYVELRRQKAEKARTKADNTYTKHFGLEAGAHRVEAIQTLMKQNMRIK